MQGFKGALLLLTSLHTFSCYSGGENKTAGSRSYALGNASVTLKDVYSIVNNIGGITALDKISAFSAFHLPYGIAELKTISAGITAPYKNVRLGLSIQNFGNRNYNEFTTGLGIAHQIRNMSIGVKVNYNQIAIAENGVYNNLLVELGGISEISKHLTFGAHVYNINQAKIGTHKKELIPVKMKAGIGIKPSQHILLCIETEKQSNSKPFLKTGFEYLLAKKLAVRAGLSSGPLIYYFGAGMVAKKVTIDYAMSSHSLLGLSHSISLSFITSGKK